MKTCILFTGLFLFALVSCTAMNAGTLKKELAAEYLELADAYTEVKKYDKAATFYERAAQHENYYNTTRYKLARVYALDKKWQEALTVLEPLYVLEPDNLLISNAYAYALLSAGEKDKALPIYEKNFADNAQDPVQARNYAEMLLIAERYQDARDTVLQLREEFGDAEYLSDLDDLEKRITTAEKNAETDEPVETVNTTEKAD